MPVAPSFQDLVAVGQAEAQLRRPDLAYFDGDITQANLHASAAMGDLCLQFAAAAYRATFFDGAEGDELTELVSDRCDIERHPSTSAQVTLTMVRTSGGAAGSIPAGARVATDFDAGGNQIVFTIDVSVAVGAAGNGPFTVAATAVDGGTAGNVQADTITKILDPLFDASFSVTNPAAAGGGNEVESDPELRNRAKLYYQTRHRGTLGALEFGALLVPSVRVAHAFEDPDTFVVTVLVSDQDGSSSLQMESDVAAELENWRCAGVQVGVLGGVTAHVDMEIQLAQVRPAFDVDGARDAIIAVVTERLATLKTRETLYLDSITAAVIALAPDDILDISFLRIWVAGTEQFFFDDRVVVPADRDTFRAGTITVLGPG